MKKTARNVIGSLAVLVVIGASATALAGSHYNYNVTVDATARYATGAQGTARNSADASQYIGCSLYAYSSFQAVWVSCFARDAAGTYVSCSSTAPALVTAISNLTSDGYIRFEYNSSGDCTYIRSVGSSYTAPKA